MRRGVSKSGSPAPKEMTSMPCARMALALACMARVGEGWRVASRSASMRGAYFLENLAFSRSSTTVGTMPVTAAPNEETSLMRREEMYVYFS